MKNLLIVESPAKAKTIEKYLGKDFKVLASYGHVRDLLPKTGAVDPEHGFAMKYEPIEKNEKHLAAIVRAVKQSEAVYFATDPDREGEAISWHLHEMLLEKKLLKGKKIHRIVFNEITKNAIQEAVKNPRDISMDLVDAYKARRALDYLVGFNLSPVLWRKVRTGLSAGRVQSPALCMIVEREEEIEAFQSQEYWTIEAHCGEKAQSFEAKLREYEGKKLEQFTINNEKQAKAIEKKLIEIANGKLLVHKVEKKERKRRPTAPFITSTLQQEAARKLGFTADRTMRTAQKLYEGIDKGDDTAGLITYMRTDSVHLSSEAVSQIRQFIKQRYGAENLPDKPNIYKTKSKNAQEAHEAIRPTDIKQTPESLRKLLNDDQYKLYDLIWKRTVASQMIHAVLNIESIDLLCGENHIFRANGSTVASPGFMSVYMEGKDDDKAEEGKEQPLPTLKEGEVVKLQGIESLQHFTEPPPRYTEASLVKALEEYGIGRPSTYASIISTLKYRKYVELERKRFIPLDVARVVKKFLVKYFTSYVDYAFTAKMEDELDAISRGEAAWVPMLEAFWSPFEKQVNATLENVSRQDVTQEEIDEKCPECTKPLAVKLGRYGKFISCTGYPDCKYMRGLDEKEGDAKEEAEVVEGRNCPQCDSDLVVKRGRYGKFIGCSNYPECKFIEPLEKPKETDVVCPVCKKGKMLGKKSRYGTIFFSCSQYPSCKYAISSEPINETCPKCQWPVLMIKNTKRRGTEKMCPQKDCKHAEQIASAQ